VAGRIRSIKPELLDDEKACALSDASWRLWVSTWVLADDFGNARAGDRYLAANVWQDTARSPRIAESLRELVRAGLISLYENSGQNYLHINGWDRHQRVDNAGKPRVPSPNESNPIDSVRFSENLGEPPQGSESLGGLPLDLRPPTSEQRPPTSRPTASPKFDFERLYQRYPRHEGKARGIKTCKATIQNEVDYQRLGRAIDAYAAKVSGKDQQYTKQFSSFMTCWTDYLEPDQPVARPYSNVPGIEETRLLLAKRRAERIEGA
jgi:hypothetical protein